MSTATRPQRPIFKGGCRYKALQTLSGKWGLRAGDILEYECHDYSVYDGAFFYHFTSISDGHEVRWCLPEEDSEEHWREFFEEVPPAKADA